MLASNANNSCATVHICPSCFSGSVPSGPKYRPNLFTLARIVSESKGNVSFERVPPHPQALVRCQILIHTLLQRTVTFTVPFNWPKYCTNRLTRGGRDSLFLFHTPTHSHTHLPTNSSTYPPTHPHTHQPTHLPTNSPTYPPTHPTYPPMNPSTHPPSNTLIWNDVISCDKHDHIDLL